MTQPFKKQRRLGSFEDLQSEARRVLEVFEQDAETDALELFDVGFEILGETLELSPRAVEPAVAALDLPPSMMKILHFVRDYIAEKQASDAEFTLGDLHLLLAEEFRKNDDLKALAAQFFKTESEEERSATLNPTPAEIVHALPASDASCELSRPLVLCCDGTGDHYEKETPTNVKVLHSLLCNAYPHWERDFLYFQGVGVTDTLDYIFGFSLPEKLKEIYHALCERWESDRELVVFGFSRGAFTARALCGLLQSCGVLLFSNTHDVAVRKSRRDELVDLFLRTDCEKEREVSLSLLEGERQCREVTVKFLGIFDTVPGIPLSEQRLFRHTEKCFPDLVKTSCHIQARNTTYLFESLSLFEERYNFSLESCPEDWSDAKGVQRFLEEKKHIEFRVPGDHCNVGGGWDTFERRKREAFIANSTLRRMLMASPFRAIVTAGLLERDGQILFPEPSTDEEWLADVRCTLCYRENLSVIEQITSIAQNVVELLCIDKKLGLSVVGEDPAPPASHEEKRELRERVHKNLKSFHVTGELLKFLRAVIHG